MDTNSDETLEVATNYQLHFVQVNGHTSLIHMSMKPGTLARLLVGAETRKSSVLRQRDGRVLLVMWDKIASVEAYPVEE